MDTTNKKHISEKFVAGIMEKHTWAPEAARRMKRQDEPTVDGLSQRTPYDAAPYNQSSSYVIAATAFDANIDDMYEDTETRTKWLQGVFDDMPAIAAAIQFIHTKYIYEFDPDFTRIMAAMPLGGMTHHGLTVMSVSCPFIQAEFPICGKTAVGVFSWLEWDIYKKDFPELRLLFLFNEEDVFSCELMLDKPTLEESLASLQAFGKSLKGKSAPRRAAKDKFIASDEGIAVIRTVMNMMLYISARNADIQVPWNLGFRRNNYVGDPTFSCKWPVGRNAGAAVRDWRESRPKGRGKKQALAVPSCEWEQRFFNPDEPDAGYDIYWKSNEYLDIKKEF